MSFLKKLFLSKAEWNYLTANSEVSGGYGRVIKSRLQKKLEVFVNQELPILVEKGYLDVTEFCNGSVTENCNREDRGDSLVRIPRQTSRDSLEDSNGNGTKIRKRWAGSELNQRPPPCQGGILTRLDHRPDIQ